MKRKHTTDWGFVYENMPASAEDIVNALLTGFIVLGVIGLIRVLT